MNCMTGTKLVVYFCCANGHGCGTCGVRRNKGKYRAPKDFFRRTPYTTSDLLNKAKSISHDDIPHLFHVLSFLYFADPAKNFTFVSKRQWNIPCLPIKF